MTHRKRMERISAIVCLAAVIGAGGCSSTRVLSSWTADPAPGPLERVMVVGVAERESVRRLFEDGFAGALAEAGVEAVAGYTALPEARGIGTEAIRAAARDAGVDRILVSRTVGVEEREIHHPPVVRTLPAPRHRRFDDYYPMAYDYVYEPGYTTIHDYVKLESNLYDAGSGELLWSAVTETVDPEETGAVVDGLCRALVERMRIDGLLP